VISGIASLSLVRVSCYFCSSTTSAYLKISFGSSIYCVFSGLLSVFFGSSLVFESALTSFSLGFSGDFASLVAYVVSLGDLESSVFLSVSGLTLLGIFFLG
jgi:hypothetical protein